MYEFSWSWFFIGTLVTAASAAVVVWYRPISDNLGSGASSYDRFKFWGLIGVLVGFVMMLNLHTVLLTLFFNSLFGR